MRDASGGTAPAVWSSDGNGPWTALTVEASTYYGRQNILSSAGCHADRIAALGAKPGGVHGNPRVSTFVETGGGHLREVRAPFERYGGPQAVNVARLTAGPQGWLIAGNRMSGAAAWTSADASVFTLHERAPGLVSTAAGESWAADGVGVAGGWLLVGGWLPKARIDRDAAGWRSSDGVVWRPLPAIGASSSYEEMHRVVVSGSATIGAGVSGGAFGVWRLVGESWSPVGTFGSVRPGGGVRELVSPGPGRLLAAVSDGAEYGLWSSEDSGVTWDPVPLPVPVRAIAESAVALATSGGSTMLAVDDSHVTRIYLAETVK